MPGCRNLERGEQKTRSPLLNRSLISAATRSLRSFSRCNSGCLTNSPVATMLLGRANCARQSQQLRKFTLGKVVQRLKQFAAFDLPPQFLVAEILGLLAQRTDPVEILVGFEQLV